MQGEEAKVVIVSLVRSNRERKVGFLKTTNRINVLLSRAQHGLYLIGNAETYSNVPMCNEVLELLRADDAVGTSFSLCYPRHTETEIEASRPEDFERPSPEGGCHLVCNRRLNDCGHQCLARCTECLLVQRLASVFIALAAIRARNLPAEKTREMHGEDRWCEVSVWPCARWRGLPSYARCCENHLQDHRRESGSRMQPHSQGPVPRGCYFVVLHMP